MASFDQLPARIEQLSQQANAFDAAQKPPFKALFDNQTFKSKHTSLTPCIGEIRETFANLAFLRQQLVPNQEKIAYVCDKLVTQMEAVQKVLHQQPRAQRSTVAPQKTLRECYEELNQHQEWARRLQLMLRNKQDQMDAASDADAKSELRSEVITLQARVNRCESALKKIDDEITHRESLTMS